MKNRYTRNIFLLLLVLIKSIASISGAVWIVGPTRTYTLPSQVSSLVQNGDTVLIDGGVYNSDVAHWTANNLLLKGTGGMAHLKANGNNYGGKAIWVIGGNNTIVDSIEFSLCTCASQNGAGIRQEGINLTVRHCNFHDNEEGILAGDNAASDILIEHTEFYNNGYGDGYSHNLYINHVNSLTFQYNYSHHAHIGHELKSRAYTNYILYNRIANEDGDASREIDLPNGGTAVIIGNEIEQGPNSQNSNIIGYGLEGLTNPTSHSLYLVNNTVVNDRTSGSFVSIQSGTVLYKAYNNLLAGTGTVLSGSAVAYDTSNNIHCSILAASMINPASYDYHLLSISPAVNGGVDAGYANTYSLNPVWEYFHPLNSTSRIANGMLDAGAHEYESVAGISANSVPDMSFEIYPNPAQEKFILSNKNPGKTIIEVYNLRGEKIHEAFFDERQYELDVNLPQGVYFIRINDGKNFNTQKLVIE